ncbi:MAG TPA: ATP-binding protein [Thermoflexales bacterium]|jgi:signal transduction histidine kinase|nr:cyclic nucleotide-binding domain-containing protein [Anaerolineae bacterium]HQV28224.1 ATP-binding protein [Thermoflexales bacterium]HQX11258.1 ATP-binding protein [Thermoflexales bacterium]HQY23670.1 ATP-binding protein [Thermoflexales bacterium]HQZ53906.1 ATP-binding protein [Thermoflexales bacterium]
MDAAFLRQLPLLAGLTDERLNWLLERATLEQIERGQVIIEEGSAPDALYVIVAGAVDIVKRAGGQDVHLAVRGRGEMLGELSLIGNEPRSATVRAREDGRLLKISRELFEALLCDNAGTAMVILQTIMKRLRNTESMVRQQEKLASLGTLAAGLAHELNNPAAAARRSAGQLGQTINTWLAARGALDRLRLPTEVNSIVLAKLREDLAAPHPHGAAVVSALDRSDREYAVESWLDTLGLDDAWEYASPLVSFGWDQPKLAAWTAAYSAEQIPVIVRWLAVGYLVHGLLDEVIDSTERISEIVKAVKGYSHLDQAAMKETDVREGLESTLVMLKHKLKQGITVVRDFAPDLPRIDAYPGELNQVWTNLIDNAIDAMQGRGELRLTARTEPGRLVVEIADNGPGIPGQVLPRIFDVFFTTKAPGEGTGLGLHVSATIVQKHGGDIGVHSQPGDTRFVVRLPLRQDGANPHSKEAATK